MKKIVCVWVIMGLLMQIAPWAAAESGSAVDELLVQLTALMDAREQVYEIRSEALQVTAQFCEQNSYPSLLHARIVCDEAIRKLRQMVAPTLTLSDETMLELIRRSVETDALEAEFEAMQTTIENEVDGLRMYKMLLYGAVYQLSQQETMQDWLALCEEESELDQRYDGLLINNLLLPVASQATEDFWRDVPNRWLRIGSRLPQWEADQSVIWEEAGQVLNRFETLTGKAAAILGKAAYAVERYADHITQADREALLADLHLISGMPAMAPLPEEWLLPEDSEIYASYDEAYDETHDEINDGSSEDGMPDVLTVYDGGVSLEAFLDYARALTDYGASLYRQQGSDAEGWRYIFVIGDQALALYWYPNGTAVAAYDPRYLSLEPPVYILCAQSLCAP